MQPGFARQNESAGGGRVHLPESSGRIPPHVALQHRGLGLTQIHDYQSIKNLGKPSIHIEAQEFSANFGILAQQNRQALAV